MSEQSPKVFVSSTIFDFRDLRSALKFWLEELGYEVLLSDHNDFPVQADLNSYQNCLEAIDRCDFFILLIGSRVGGWYDATNRISITQAEYRRAYQRLREGRIKLLTFVRQDLWNVREDRKELEKFLKAEIIQQKELTDADIANVVSHPSKFVNDADFMFGFLNEVTRNVEMKSAIAGVSDLPIGNWVRQFTTFRDIIDALRVELRFATGLRRMALLANLKAEIVTNLQILTHRSASDNSVCPKYVWASHARRQFHGGLNDVSQIEGKYLKWLSLFAGIGCGVGKNLTTPALDTAITSGEFLDFDKDLNSWLVGPFQEALLELRHHIARLRSLEETLDTKARLVLVERFKQLHTEQPMSVLNIDILSAIAVHDEQHNVVTLMKSIFRAAQSDATSVEHITLYGKTPLEVEDQRMSEEIATPEQIRQWIEVPD